VEIRTGNLQNAKQEDDHYIATWQDASIDKAIRHMYTAAAEKTS
jgi:hypothetical protein